MGDKHQIAPVLEHYGSEGLDDTRPGWVKTKCPFHGDSHASAAVNYEFNYFKCFACDMQGDTYELIMRKERIDFREAVIFAESISGKSNNNLSGSHRSGRGVSGKAGAYSSGRKYVPPRGRRATNRRA